jgi:hypothetical protein
LPTPLLNLICTNVPGSPTPLYSVGKRMLSSYPHVPTGYELGVGVAVQSYNGKMCFGLTADAVVCADVNRLRDFIRVSWNEISKAAGVKPASQPSAAEHKKPAPKKNAAKPARVVATRKPKPVKEPAPAGAPPAAQRQKPALKSRPTKPARAATPQPVAAKEPAPAEAPPAAQPQEPAPKSRPAKPAEAAPAAQESVPPLAHANTV